MFNHTLELLRTYWLKANKEEREEIQTAAQVLKDYASEHEYPKRKKSIEEMQAKLFQMAQDKQLQQDVEDIFTH